MKKRTIFILLLLLFLHTVTAQIRIACVGNSITEGAGSSDRANKSYVALLKQMMGNSFDVRNFGVSGATVCRDTYKPYNKCELFERAKEFMPNIVIIKLGTNDSQPRVWNTAQFADHFEHDLADLCDEFSKLESKPKLYLCIPIPIIPSSRWTHQPEVLINQIIPKIKRVARKKHIAIIDLYSPLVGRTDCYPSNDMLHPNDLGHLIIASTVFNTLMKAECKTYFK